MSISLCLFCAVCLQAGLKVKKATETYKSYVEKYANAKTEFEQRMTESTQVQLCDVSVSVFVEVANCICRVCV